MLTELSALLDLLKAKGVTHFEGPCVLPEDPTMRLVIDLALADAKPDKEEPNRETCACGHHVTDHQDGGCLRGCSDKECNP